MAAAAAAVGGGQQQEFECNICLDAVTEPVVSLCGHLFCWPCLHRWMVARPQAPCCPVCKGPISEADLVPVYGRSHRDAAAAAAAAAEGGGGGGGPPIPPRPSARRPPGQRRRQLGGLHLTIDLDAGGLGASAAELMSDLQESLEQLEVADVLGPLVSRAFLCIAMVLGLWLLIV